MDGKLCIWGLDRVACGEVQAHDGSISALSTDERANLCITGMFFYLLRSLSSGSFKLTFLFCTFTITLI
jgi:hypothetical protein